MKSNLFQLFILTNSQFLAKITLIPLPVYLLCVGNNHECIFILLFYDLLHFICPCFFNHTQDDLLFLLLVGPGAFQISDAGMQLL